MGKLTFILSLSFLISFKAAASLVAIIDSGLDVDHSQLAGMIWQNEIEANGLPGVDDDGNGLIDDLNGWDFAANSATLIDPILKNGFNADMADYFDLQYRIEMTKLGVNLASAEEIASFPTSEAMGKSYDFAHVAHGTHVAGIVAKNNSNVQLMGIKKADTSVNLAPYLKELANYNVNNVAYADAEGLRRTATYLNENGVRVANGSFGTPYEAVINRFNTSLMSLHMSFQEVKYVSSLYQQRTLIEQQQALALSPNTLFVFAAGNSGYNNDTKIFTPANIVADNSLTVAATAGRDYLPEFSCYGMNTVHVAAPGVGIISTVPGNAEMRMTGTSQAAPYVTRVASMIVDQNESLTPKMIKRIIMETVDYKPFLKGKVISGGIVNQTRAIYAASQVAHFGLELAIRSARTIIPDEL